MVNCLIYSVRDQREQELHVPNRVLSIAVVYKLFWHTTTGQCDPVILI